MFHAIDAADLVYATELVKASDGPVRIDLGGLEVLLHCHSGHTPGDLTVHVPSRDVMVVDLIFQYEYRVTLDAVRHVLVDVDDRRRAAKPLRAVGAFVPERSHQQRQHQPDGEQASEHRERRVVDVNAIRARGEGGAGPIR